MRINLSTLFLLSLIQMAFAFNDRKILHFDQDFSANSQAGRDLIASSTLVDGSRSVEQDNEDFLGLYSIKFIDCRTVSQWKGDTEDKGDTSSQITETKLVRYRLCPTSSCSSKTSTGCTSKYGDYIVDISTFIYNYLSAQALLNQSIKSQCQNECSNNSNTYCTEECFSRYGGRTVMTYLENGASFDPRNYATCSAYKDYYLAPYCSTDAKSIYLGIYADNECAEFSSCGTSCFKSTYGFKLPFADTSVLSHNCVSCSSNYISQHFGGNGNYNYGTIATCEELYTNSGKCETRMSISYPNESACTYIQGLHKIQQNGGSYTKNVRRSKGASVAIGLISFTSILLGFYVQYLSTSKFSITEIIFFFVFCATIAWTLTY